MEREQSVPRAPLLSQAAIMLTPGLISRPRDAARELSLTSELDKGDLVFGDFAIDRSDERLLGPEGPVHIGNTAYRLLLRLVESPGRLVTKDELFSSIWDGTTVSESSLTSAVKEIRRALGDDPKNPRFIESVYGRGYRFVAPVHRRRQASLPSAEALSEAAPMARKGEGRPPLVLVSAFRDEAVSERHSHCAAQIREEVLSGLARFREIRLVDDDRPEGEAAAMRGPASPRDYQLSATLMPDGEGIKSIARAKRLIDGRVVWAETLSLADSGTAAGVERIVRRIVGSALPAVDEDMFLRIPRETADLYDSYLLAKHRSYHAESFVEAKRAAEALEAIIAERPGFGLAYPPLVRLYNIDFGYTGLGSSGPDERARALDLAKRGLAADRGNVHAYTVLGFCYLWHEETARALDCFEKALALNPYNHIRLQEVAAGRMYRGDFDAAAALLDRALELNPFPDDNFHEDLGRLRLIQGEYEVGRDILNSILGGTIWADLYLALCELGLGLDEGRSRIESWCARVKSKWAAERKPDAKTLLAWVRLHHPLPAKAGAPFFADLEKALV